MFTIRGLIFLYIFLPFSFIQNGTAQDMKNIPPIVQDSFNSKFPNASNVTWYNSFTFCKASFIVGTTPVKSTFSLKGEWIKTEYTISLEALPESVKNGFQSSKYGTITIKEINKTEEKNKPETYRITVMKGAVNKTALQFSEDGKLLSERNFL